MTHEPPPEENKPPQGDAPYLAKRRLPFETGQRSPGVVGAGILYGAAMLALFGLAAYMALVQQRPLASVAVIAPFVGGLYFLIRMLMVLRPRIRKD